MGIMHPIKLDVQQMALYPTNIQLIKDLSLFRSIKKISLQLKLFDGIWVSILWSWKYPLELALNHFGMRVENPSREKPFKIVLMLTLEIIIIKKEDIILQNGCGKVKVSQFHVLN